MQTKMLTLIDMLKFIGSVAGIALIFFIVITTINQTPSGYVSLAYTYNHIGSCENACGGSTLTPGGNCFCDDKCYAKGDCCIDIKRYC